MVRSVPRLILAVRSRRESITRKQSFWVWLGHGKDQLTIILAIVGIPFVAFQYFQSKLDTRISRTIDYVSKQESADIVSARTNLDVFIISDILLKYKYSDNIYFSDELSSQLSEKINANRSNKSNYIKDFYTLHYFYTDVSACTTSGLCDKFSACYSFFKQIQSFRANNDSVYVDLENTFHDSRSAALDEFIRQCDNPDFTFGVEGIDTSISCRVWLYFRSLAMVDWFTLCRRPNP